MSLVLRVVHSVKNFSQFLPLLALERRRSHGKDRQRAGFSGEMWNERHALIYSLAEFKVLFVRDSISTWLV